MAPAARHGRNGRHTCPTIAELVPGFDGYYWQVLPSGNTPLSGTNYPFGDPAGGCPATASWATSGYIKSKPALTVEGTTGQKYTINFSARGVVGTRCYTGGTPGATAVGNPNGQNNTWYAGGAQYNNSIWNTMELRVAPKVAGQPNADRNTGYDIYFTNSFQNIVELVPERSDLRDPVQRELPGDGRRHDHAGRPRFELPYAGELRGRRESDVLQHGRVAHHRHVGPHAGADELHAAAPGSADGNTYQIQWLWIDVTSVTCN